MMVVAQDMPVHFPLALLVMIASWLFGRWLGVANMAAVWTGWFAAACVCIMREATQHEYRWIEAVGQGQRVNMPSLEGLKFWDWNAHSQFETLGALGLSALVAQAIAKWV